MNKTINLLITFIFIIFSGCTYANPTLDMIEQLEIKKAESSNKNLEENKAAYKEKKPLYITLSNGKKIDIQDWSIVHFMASNCSFCKSFNPKLKQISEQTGIPVYTYSFDGQGDDFFPLVFDANEEVLREFFAELPRATPTDFLINVNNLVTLPLSQGDLSQQAFLQRLDEVFIYIDKNLKGVIK